jgi:hypothetical protein
MSEPWPKLSSLGLVCLKVGRTRVIPSSLRETARFDLVERERDSMIVEMTAYVTAHRLARETQTVTFEVPASWWQHWKQDAAPEWLRRRWPVRTRRLSRTVRFETFRAYPDAQVPHAEILRDGFIWEMATQGLD